MSLPKTHNERELNAVIFRRDTGTLRFLCVLVSLWQMSFVAFGQHPLNNPEDAVEIRYSVSQPVIAYSLLVDGSDLSGFKVVMRIRNVPDTFRVAMVAHPEYDDRFWRFVKDLRVETKVGSGNVFREDSAVWRIIAPGGEATLHYTIHLPAPRNGQRGAWRPFLSATGGLVGGPHSFMYVVGATLAPSHITLHLPPGWMAATGLEPTADPSTFFAPSVAVLVDGPILIGHFRSWKFAVDQVPHRVVYWSSPHGVAFDTVTLVEYIQRFVEQAKALFGRLPYREYSFLFQDDSYGALEHRNSVTIGLPSAALAKDVASYLPEIAHEYFHTWNLMRIQPIEYGDVNYKPQSLSRGLWWSEGLTMFYADLLTRRADLPNEDSSRVRHLERLMGWYYGSPGNMNISPELVSLASYGPPGMLGDYSASSHLQGELLGTLLDLLIRDASNGKHSMDDLMRKMMERYSGAQGFTNKDVEQLASEVCECPIHPFFEDHIFGNKRIDFDKYLRLAGLSMGITWKNALGEDGKPSADFRVYAFESQSDKAIRLGISDPAGCWGRAGLHTGDVLISVNQSPVNSRNDFWELLRKIQIGDTITVEIQRPTGKLKTKVTVTGYQQPVVHIVEIKEANERQRYQRKLWLNGI